MTDTLLPCPFCGSKVKPNGIWVHCSKKKLCPLHGIDILEHKWNHRPSPWQDISSAPRDGERVLVLFAKSGHIEDATFHSEGDYSVTYMLFNGEQLNDSPDFWMPIPPGPKE